jgi:hypothetical protein
MNKRVLIGLLTAGVVAMWGTEANASNRILGVIITHNSPWLAQVVLRGFEAHSRLVLTGEAPVEILCEKPGNRISKRKVRLDKPEQFKRKVRFDKTEQLTAFPITTGVTTVSLDVSSAKCPGDFLKVKGSDGIEPDLMVAWEKCVGSTARDSDPCFKGGVKTTEPIETVKTSNCVPANRDPEDGSVPAQILTCNVVQVGPDGPPPPPPPGCGDGAERRKRPD